MTELLHDLPDSWRGFRRDRLYAAAAISTLALSLGATTAIFSIVNGVLLRPLTYPHCGAKHARSRSGRGAQERVAAVTGE